MAPANTHVPPFRSPRGCSVRGKFTERDSFQEDSEFQRRPSEFYKFFFFQLEPRREFFEVISFTGNKERCNSLAYDKLLRDSRDSHELNRP